ncbi:MAG: hypothetical protein ACOH2A_13890 [Sphingobacteriaceae bacterium]
MGKWNIFFVLIWCFTGFGACAQTSFNQSAGHSHNDYNQASPFLTAYQAGMESIEADVFLVNGLLYVAHERDEVMPGKTLAKFYLQPLAVLFGKNDSRPFADTLKKLQLVIDIKEHHEQVIPELIRELKPYRDMIDPLHNKYAVRVVLSGDMPAPAHFKDYPDYIFYDGRPYIGYTPAQLKQVAMISDALTKYTTWNGIGTLPQKDQQKLASLVQKADQQHKPFRFWATKDNPNTWKQLEKIGVHWMNTDHPQQLQTYFKNKGEN